MGFAGDRRLASNTSMVCSIVGSLFGAMALRARAYEAFVAVQDGADEVDMVLDIGAVLSGDFVAVSEAIATVVDAARPSPVEVIFENCLLTDNQKIAACLMSAAGPAYVKNFHGHEHRWVNGGGWALMRAAVGDALGVKAAGAVRSREDTEAMLAADADRIGTPRRGAIISDNGASAQSDGGY